jgi:hypothetical protein
MSKVRDVVRARIKARIDAQNRVAAAPVAGPSKTKAELQDELDAAGIEYPKDARKAELEALLPGLGNVTIEDIP